MPPVVYIAHPLSMGGPDQQEANFERYLELVGWAVVRGHAVISWAHHHLLGVRELELPPEEWLRLDAALIERADEVWFALEPDGSLPDSIGMAAEIEMARLFGKPILYALPDPTAGWIVQTPPVGGDLEAILQRAGAAYKARGGHS